MKLLKRIINKVKHELLRIEVKLSKYEYGLNKNDKRKKKIIVSLTTFPGRFYNLELCIKSILRQTVKADKIIIWLGSDSNEYDLDSIFEKYKKYGVEIEIDPQNDYKSHKKYLYSFKKYPKDLIITMDDDLIYPKDTIESLLKKHEQYPNAIIARRVHKITWNNQKISKYKDWIEECNNEHLESHLLFATTGAGTLFPPDSLSKEYDDVDLIKRLSFSADDVWLKFMALRKNTKIVWAENTLQMPTTIKQSQRFSLQQQNVENNQNDKQINNIMNYFKITKKDFQK